MMLTLLADAVEGTTVSADLASTRPRSGRSALRDPRVAGYVLSRTTSKIADQTWVVALALAAAGTGDPRTAALVIAAGTVPRAVLLAVGGSVADRVAARPLLIGADAARVAVLGLGALALLTAPVVPVLVAVGVSFGLVSAFSDPAASTFPRRLVVREELTRVAALLQLGGRAALLVGPPLAGVVLAVADLPGVMLTGAALFTVAALALAFVRPRLPRVHAAREPVVTAVRSAARYVRRTPRVGHLVLALSGLNVFAVPVTTVGLALRVTDEGWGPTTLGFLIGCIGAGAAVGTVLTLRWRPARPVVVGQVVLLAQAGGLASIGFASKQGVIAAVVVVGLTAGIASPLLAGAFQAVVDDPFIGRVASLLAIVDAGLIPLALTGFGALAAVTGLDWACAACGFGMAALMLTGLARRDVAEPSASETSSTG